MDLFFIAKEFNEDLKYIEFFLELRTNNRQLTTFYYEKWCYFERYLRINSQYSSFWGDAEGRGDHEVLANSLRKSHYSIL